MHGLSNRIVFTDEQAMLLDAATAFCRDKAPITSVRAQMTSEHGFERAIWDEMVALGWSGIAVPERFGGSGLSLAEAATIAEPMGRRLFATPFGSTQIFVHAALAGGSEAQQADWLARVAAGAIATTAVLEPEGDWTLAHAQASAVREGGALALAGTKTLVCDADVAELLMATVSLDGAPALVVLERGELPVGALRRDAAIDETRRAYTLTLDGMRVPQERLIAGAHAQAALRALSDAALLLASAEAAGGIAGALDLMVDYLNTRTAFGRKIGSYQSLKHTCAEILIGLERSRSHLYHAATLLAAGEDAEVALRMAKLESGETFAWAGDRAVQFHGGFGFTWDCDAQIFLRRALFLHGVYGDGAHHRARLGELLFG
ncbi:acyl-CoA dehydrogenase family protein [Quisquiliibacterium transsilvanicum]|uniref:Alkylation response protein AidB-like acyl-CoA dehydrogenase n=1 Tax=Quisquiliibacterium transsilvanicum TaxID=1549638 RepID=A0A7W8M8C9_9BURK|nr:acyl-CoA dehydrogenase family protein [Quisquiliibacterium transsilvanicum]MBB5271678.1 alkylation response protein AidB-like acyl-CoA dehydrogenase [Quisquiliibacterium transsilvanicum]